MWIAEADGVVAAFLVLGDRTLDHLYVEPARTRLAVSALPSSTTRRHAARTASRSGRSRRTTVRAGSTSVTACSRSCSRTERTTRSAARTCSTGGNLEQHRCAPSRNGSHSEQGEFCVPTRPAGASGGARRPRCRCPGGAASFPEPGRVHEPGSARGGRACAAAAASAADPVALLVLALAFAAGAAAHPQARVPVRVDNATIVLLVDVSGSMSAGTSSRRGSTRPSPRCAVRPRLPKGFKVGLVQFSDSPTVLAAPTADHERDRADPRPADARLGDRDRGRARDGRRPSRRARSRATASSRLPAGGFRPRSCCSPTASRTRADLAAERRACARSARGFPSTRSRSARSHGVLGYGPFAKRVAPDAPLMRKIAEATGRRDRDRAATRGSSRPSTSGCGGSFGHRDADAGHRVLVRGGGGAACSRGPSALGRALRAARCL